MAERLRAATASSLPARSDPELLDATRADELTRTAVETLASQYDRAHGGFGGAPKFPPAMTCAFLLLRAERTGDHAARDIAVGTLEAIVRGGIYDQIGGGLVRYSVDAAWRVPHFEKMLSDNALLLDCLVRWKRLTGSPLAGRAARETADFMPREMATPQGGFAASLDADSEGGEGAFYTWTPGQLRAALGEADAEWAAAAYDVDEAGQLEGGRSTLTLHRDPADGERLRRVREALGSARDLRPRPARDDKVVAAWNGLAIGALADAAADLGEPRYAAAAESAAELILRVHLDGDGRLLRASRDGSPGAAYGVLEDYACLADGLLSLHAVTGEPRWRDAAAALLAGVDERFSDGGGGLFDTAVDAEALIARPRTPLDGATPAGQAVVGAALIKLGRATGDETHLRRALALTTPLTTIASRSPRHGATALSVLEMLLTLGWPA